MRERNLITSHPRIRDYEFAQNSRPMDGLRGAVVKNKLETDGLTTHEIRVDRRNSAEAQCADASIDYDLPEMVVFLQEYNHQFDKDICIDNGMAACDKDLVEDSELDPNSMPCILNSDEGRSCELTEETQYSLSSNSIESKCISEQGCIKDVTKWHDSMDLMFEEKGEFYLSEDDSTGHSKWKNSQTIGEIIKREAPIENSMVFYSTEPNIGESKASEEDSSWIGLKDRSIKVHGSSPAKFGRKKQLLQSEDPQQPAETRSMSRPENKQLERQRGSIRCIDEHRHEISIAFATDPLSESIPCTRSATKSSHTYNRSSSSGGSSHSFAFPVLTSEWNGSPVRMVKANRRQLRSNRWWKLFLLCCKD